MSDAVLSSLIGIVPELLLVILVVVVVLALRRPIVDDILPRLGGVRLGVLEVSLQPKQVEAAVETAAKESEFVAPPPGFGEAVVARARRIGPELRRTRVLWHDPRPENTLVERQLLHDLGVFVEAVTTLDAAEAALQSAAGASFGVVISNIGPDKVGLRVAELLLRSDRPGLIYYVGYVAADQGVPPRAHGITNRPDELLHLVMDIVERGDARLPGG